jgi:glycosyltransferase involved in cell wall biosynthesis
MPPTVSIVVPCYNEEGTIGSLLEAILTQTFPRHEMEVVIADSLSRDRTREVISDFGRAHPDLALRIVENAHRTIPSSLNLAIREARGEFLIRLDAHSIPIPEYVERCVQDIRAGKGANVGGVWKIQPGGSGWIARGIAVAASHPLGAGDALYRLGAPAGPVDTVPFGAFRRQLLDQVKGFDETLLTNEDYEFNVRIRRSGGVVWLDPQIVSTYFARATLRDLAAQYWRYGYWKCRMLLRYPSSIRWRQALPPLFLLGMLCMAVGALFWMPALRALVLVACLYLVAVLAAGIAMGVRARDGLLIVGSPLALATMHLAWGSGFLWSLLTSLVEFHG